MAAHQSINPLTSPFAQKDADLQLNDSLFNSIFPFRYIYMIYIYVYMIYTYIYIYNIIYIIFRYIYIYIKGIQTSRKTSQPLLNLMLSDTPKSICVCVGVFKIELWYPKPLVFPYGKKKRQQSTWMTPSGNLVG